MHCRRTVRSSYRSNWRSSRPLPAIAEPLEPRQLLSADLAAAFVGQFPSLLDPGRGDKIAVSVTNVGDAPATGAMVRVFASADGTLDPANDVLLATAARSKGIQPSRSATLKLRIQVP